MSLSPGLWQARAEWGHWGVTEVTWSGIWGTALCKCICGCCVEEMGKMVRRPLLCGGRDGAGEAESGALG
jgi:hypothetical protein